MPSIKPAAETLSIGAISRASGVPVATLRSWEERFGRPRPQRLPSGHRRYSSAQARWAQLVAQAIRQGLRTAEAVALDASGLVDWLWSHSVSGAGGEYAGDLWTATRRFDTAALAQVLERVLVERDLEYLLDDVLDPFLADLRAAQLTNPSAATEASFARHAMDHFLLARCHVFDVDIHNPRPRILVGALTPDAGRLRLTMFSAAAQRAGLRSLRIDPCESPPVLVKTAVAAGVRAIAVTMSLQEDRKLARDLLRELAPLATDAGFPVLVCGDVVTPGSGRNVADVPHVRKYAEAVTWLRALPS